MKKDNVYYFKKPLILSIPITVFVIVRDLFDVEFYDNAIIFKIVVKAVIVGITTVVILGIINVFAKVETFKKKK